MNELARDIARNLLTDDPEIEGRIQRGIAEHRQGSGVIELVDSDGQSVSAARISLTQRQHEFHFGCNAFMLEQFPEAERNAAYAETFAETFNLAVCPFYWADTEPEEGKPRFAKDSPHVYRRPPTDLLLEFCDRYCLTPKGHPLCWHQFLPDWAALDRRTLAIQIERRIAAIAARYGDRIRIWDVCNEALGWDPTRTDMRMPENHVEFAFRVASQYLPPSAVLTYNDYLCWQNHGDYTGMYMLGRHLRNLDVNLGALGLQFHMFGRKVQQMRDEAESRLNPRHLFAVMDQYAKLGLPLNISEITITAHPDLGDGPAFQKEVAERLYRIWFSHPALNGIIWWNLVDDTAYVNPKNPGWNENAFKGGLLNNDMSPKPAYSALKRLITEEWRTQTKLAYAHGADNRFRGFYGDYTVNIETDGGSITRDLKLSRGSINHFTLTLA